MHRTIGDAILYGLIPTGVLGVAAAGHQAVVTDERKRIGAARGIVSDHRIGTERALATEGQCAELLGRYTALKFVVEGLTRPRAVAGERITLPGEAVVGDVGGWHVGELAGLRVDAGRSVEHREPILHELYLASDAHTGLREVIR